MIQRKKWNKLEVDLYGLTCNLTFHLLVVVENALWARLAEHLVPVPVPVTLGLVWPKITFLPHRFLVS